MRRLLTVTSILLGAACGPTATGSPTDAGGSQGSTDDTGSLDHGETTGTTSDPSGGPTSSMGSSSGASDETGTLGELLPAESAITSATCNDDGSMLLVVEAFFDVPVDGCAPPPEISPDGYLLVRMEAWNQFPGVFEVAPGGPAQVTYGMESMTGTLTLDVWAPGHASLLTIDVAGESTTLLGTIELEACTVEVGDCIPPPPDGG